MAHEKTARALVEGAKAYIDKRFAGLERRVAELEVQLAAAHAKELATVRAAARARAADGDDEIIGIRN